MSYSVLRPDRLLGAAALVAVVALAQPAHAVPLLDIGANAGVAAHLTQGGPALDATAELNLRGLVLAGEYWTRFGATSNYWQVGARYNVSPVPMLSVSPGVGLVSATGAAGPMANLTAGFSPFLLPVSIEAAAGAAFVSGGLLLPYHAGVKFSPLPLISVVGRYRGWAGQAITTVTNQAGPEIGIEIGI